MHTPESASPSKRVRLCRWLLGIIWSTVITGIVVGTLSNLNTTSVNQGSSLRYVFSQLFLIRLIHTHPIPMSIGVILLIVITGLLGLGSREPLAPASPSHQITTQNRTRLLKRLHVRYTQLRDQSLQGAVEMELGLASRPAALANATSLAYRLPAQPDQLLPPQTTIVDVYEQAREELLILGEPGAGKSTLLGQLASHLLTQSEQDDNQPIPVLLPLSTWATKRPLLQNWISDEFARLYDIPKKLSTQWIEAEMILPLLDGLDEMDEDARPACIAAINAYHHEHLHPLVVCSRITEYEHAAKQERFALHTAVVVQPLSAMHVDTHLATFGKSLAALRIALNKNATLATLATTPLMLQILILTYQGTTVRHLSNKKAELEQQIWTAYIQRMIERKGDVKRYLFHQTIAYLHWLARGMQEHNLTIFYLEHIQPDWLPPRQIFFYRLSVGLVAGLILGLLFGLVGELLFGLAGGLLFGLVGWLVGIIVCGLLFGLVGGFIWSLLFAPDRWSWKRARGELAKGLTERLVKKQQPRIVLHEVLTWSWKKARDELIFALFVGLVFGLVIGLARGLVSGLLYGLAGGLIVGLRGGFSTNQFTERLHLSPNEGIRRTIKNGLFLAVIVGLLLDLVFGLIFGLTQGSVLVEAGFGLVFGLLLALQVAVQSVVCHYILRVFFWRTQVFPWNAPQFLEDARARILLQRVGGGYSFTHRLLLDYFANLDIMPPSTASPVIPPTQQSPQP